MLVHQWFQMLDCFFVSDAVVEVFICVVIQVVLLVDVVFEPVFPAVELQHASVRLLGYWTYTVGIEQACY